jgi:hypothetical protein
VPGLGAVPEQRVQNVPEPARRRGLPVPSLGDVPEQDVQDVPELDVEDVPVSGLRDVREQAV